VHYDSNGLSVGPLVVFTVDKPPKMRCYFPFRFLPLDICFDHIINSNFLNKQCAFPAFITLLLAAENLLTHISPALPVLLQFATHPNVVHRQCFSSSYSQFPAVKFVLLTIGDGVIRLQPLQASVLLHRRLLHNNHICQVRKNQNPRS
jgi:acyl carrier protein phosphodiesterase